MNQYIHRMLQKDLLNVGLDRVPHQYVWTNYILLRSGIELFHRYLTRMAVQ